jgi:superfamily I DNA and/or RNA helicase
MIRLDNFQHPQTIPRGFEIINLARQYRSVPAIGRLYSEYAYGGAIESHRTQDSQRKLNLKGINQKSVNFVMFPVHRTSIYEPHVVANSNIHIYSALFAYEFIKYLASNIESQQDEKPWRIGVISPYRAQAEIINKLWEERTELYSNVDVQIGTVHGFQGDECDIIVAVYNPPARGMKRNAGNVFVNKKNILNVAISRAQDYLFLLMPDGDYEDYYHKGSFVVGAGVFAGLQLFIADLPIAVGLELGYSGQLVAESVPSYRYKTEDVDQKFKEGTRSVRANWGADAAITFSYYFH